jgi:hypothetical protein
MPSLRSVDLLRSFKVGMAIRVALETSRRSNADATMAVQEGEHCWIHGRHRFSAIPGRGAAMLVARPKERLAAGGELRRLPGLCFSPQLPALFASSIRARCGAAR